VTSSDGLTKHCTYSANTREQARLSYLNEAKITIVCAETSSVSFSRPNHLVLGSVTVALLLPARAQQLAMPTIGFLYSQSRDAIGDRVAAFITASRKQALSKAKTSRSNTAGVFIAVLGCPANPFVDKGGIRRCPRRTSLHLSYSCATPFGPAILVTQGPTRT
jgi:hypothetical protein